MTNSKKDSQNWGEASARRDLEKLGGKMTDQEWDDYKNRVSKDSELEEIEKELLKVLLSAKVEPNNYYGYNFDLRDDVLDELKVYINAHYITKEESDRRVLEGRIDEAFEEKMKRLTKELNEQFTKSHQLEAKIKENLKKIGYEI